MLDMTKEALALPKMPDTEIECQDVPENADFDPGKRGLFYHPIKRAVPNELTLETHRKVEYGNGVVAAKDAADLFHQLEA